MMVPMAMTDDAAAPEMAPKTADVTQATIPRPPGIRPAIAFARSSSRRAMLPPVTRYPSVMKNGMLSSVTELMLVNPTGSRNDGSIPFVIERKMIEMRNPKGMGIPEKIAQAKMRSDAAIIQSMSRSPLWRRAWRPGRSGR